MENLEENIYFKKLSILTLFIFIIGGIFTFIQKNMDFISYTYMMIYFLSFAIGGFLGMKILLSKKTPFNKLWRGILFLSISMFFLSLSAQDFSLIQSGYKLSSEYSDVIFITILTSGIFMIIGTLDSLSIYAFRFSYKIFIEIAISFIVFYFMLGNLLPELSSQQSYYLYANTILITLIYLIIRISHSKICKGVYILGTGLLFMFIGNSIIAFKSAHNTHFIGDTGDFFIILSGLILSLGIYRLGKTFTQKFSQ